MKFWRYLIVGALLVTSSACTWLPPSHDVNSNESLEFAVSQFKSEAALDRFFDGAVGYVVFPNAVRAGSGFGGALGSGWLVEQDSVTGWCTLFEFFAGANIGGQVYRSILFFRTDKSLQRFKRGRFEFTGQANAALVVVGKGLTPSFNQEVAMFTQLRGGLLLEASVGTQRYDVFPLKAAAEE